MEDTILLKVKVHKVSKFGMLTDELLDSSQSAEGEILNAEVNLVLCLFDNQGENLAFNVGIVNGGVRFVKVNLTSNEAVGSFGRGLEILSAFGLPSGLQAGCFIIIIIHDVLAGQAPEVKQGINLATEAEHIRLKFLFLADNGLVDNALTAFVLEVQPFVEVGGIKMIDIKFCKGHSFLKVEHGIISADSFDILHIVFQFSGSGSPVGQGDFTFSNFSRYSGRLEA